MRIQKGVGLAAACLLCLAAQGSPNREQSQPELLLPERMEALAGQVRSARWDEAIQAGESLLTSGLWLDERLRSEVHFATALALAMRAGEVPRAIAQPLAPVQPGAIAVPAQAAPLLGEGYLEACEDFESSRALAGPGELRLAATYDLGTSSLLRGELWRAEIPEIAQAGGQQPMAPAPHAGAATTSGEETAPDPLSEARQAYLEGKARLLVRLRSDWSDVDTRANLELIQRRLRELDEIEAARQQEQQDSEDQEQDSEDQDQQKDEEKDQQEDPSEDQQKEDQEQQDQDKNSEPKEGDQEPEEQPSDEEQEAPEEGESERQDSEAEGAEAESSKEEPAERKLTREEVIRLLDKLAEMEAEAEQIRAAQAKGQTVRVDRDW